MGRKFEMNIHVIIGEDDYLVEEAAKKAVGDGEGIEVIDSSGSSNAESQLSDIRRVEESVMTPPFLEPRKVTWWKNVGFLPGGKSSEEVKAALERFAQTLSASPLPTNQSLVVSGERLLQTSVFAKTLKSCADFVVFASGKPWEAVRNAVSLADGFARDIGLSFAPGAAESLVSVVGTDARSLSGEVRKLRDYLGSDGAVVSVADVKAVASPGVGIEPMPWDVTDAVGRRDLSSALAAIRRFELESGFAVFMTGVLERFFRQMIDVAAGHIEGMSPFSVRKFSGFLRNWSASELSEAQSRFVRLRERAVMGTSSVDVLVVPAVVRTVRGGRSVFR